MKKLTLILAAAICAVTATTLSACGSDKNDNQSSIAETTVAATTEESKPVITESVTETTVAPSTEEFTWPDRHPTNPDGTPRAVSDDVVVSNPNQQ